MTLDDFETLARSRRSVRHFKPELLPNGLLERLLAIAQRSPSGYNLQPAHFVAVTDPEVRARLHNACMSQTPVLEAPATVVFCGDRNVYFNHHERVMAMDQAEAKISPEYEKLMRKYIPLAFSRSPMGVGKLIKKCLPFWVSRLTPIPHFPAAHMDEWLTRQTMLAAMSFMLAAQAAGLGTLPMEGFDERRVKKVLGIPSSIHVVVIIAIGFVAPDDNKEGKTRLPLREVLHSNRWS